MTHFENPLPLPEFWLFYRWLWMSCIILMAVMASTGLSAPVARPILWSEVPHVLKVWKAVNPSGMAAWASTGSMIPDIMPSDLLLVEAYIGQPLKGEIPVYFFSDEIPSVPHECIAEGKTWFIAKGNNNAKADPIASKKKVKYVVVAVLRPGY